MSNGKHYPKVCCACDRFILYGEEDFVNEKFFENEKKLICCPTVVIATFPKKQ
jgi:hypothetical protein